MKPRRVGAEKPKATRRAQAKPAARVPVDDGRKRVEVWRFVSRDPLARLMGVHPDTVTAYVRQGMPVVQLGGRGAESIYDAIECLSWQRAQMGKNAKDNAQTRVFDLTAKLKEVELDLQLGKLVERDQVIKDGRAFAKGLQAMIRGLPRRLIQAGILEPMREHEAAELCRELLLEVSAWQSRIDVEASIEKAEEQERPRAQGER
jgi:hypothetical protein